MRPDGMSHCKNQYLVGFQMQFGIGDAGEGLGGLDDVVDPGQLPGNLGHLVLVENVDGSTVDDQLKI
jgi:hypothetical protein